MSTPLSFPQTVKYVSSVAGTAVPIKLCKFFLFITSNVAPPITKHDHYTIVLRYCYVVHTNDW